MTQIPSTGSVLAETPPDIDLRSSGNGSTTETAKDQAGQVAETATAKGKEVVGTAKQQAETVVAETGRQAQDLVRQARQELASQAANQQQRLAGSLRALSEELGAMSEHDGEHGVASDLARQASSAVGEVAGWFDAREPGQLLNEARSFAQRRPGAFLALALGAGLAAGRLTRAEVSAVKEQHEQQDSSSGNDTRAFSARDPQALPTSGGPGDLGTALPHPSSGTGLGDPLGGVRR